MRHKNCNLAYDEMPKRERISKLEFPRLEMGIVRELEAIRNNTGCNFLYRSSLENCKKCQYSNLCSKSKNEAKFINNNRAAYKKERRRKSKNNGVKRVQPQGLTNLSDNELEKEFDLATDPGGYMPEWLSNPLF